MKRNNRRMKIKMRRISGNKNCGVKTIQLRKIHFLIKRSLRLPLSKCKVLKTQSSIKLSYLQKSICQPRKRLKMMRMIKISMRRSPSKWQLNHSFINLANIPQELKKSCRKRVRKIMQNRNKAKLHSLQLSQWARRKLFLTIVDS